MLFAMTASADAFTIHNDGSHTVSHIYIEEPSYPDWGPDLLIGYLNPNDTWTPRTSIPCVEDIKDE